ncbi:GNAT family N-acetyltransferase [Kiritimatiellota bacterium B12222]|nr:GNAT family N-acetyltransferase [Kiritimatiellota bacterium B12222]
MYPIFPENLPDVSVLRSGHYVTDFARNTGELEEVQRLRFEVFNLEMGEGLDDSYLTSMDVDAYDVHCHHLIVRDQRDGSLVGTYRLQSRRMSETGHGFYSATEFDLGALSDEILDQALELGRACISKSHRNGRVLFLLWRGLLAYADFNRLTYMFGCCSLTSQDAREGWALYQRLGRAGHLHERYALAVQEAYRCEKVEVGEEEIFVAVVPRLMNLYLDYGARVCSVPAVDTAFKTIDFLMLFDRDDIPLKQKNLFK